MDNMQEFETIDEADLRELNGPVSLRYNLDTLEDYLETGELFIQQGRLFEASDVLREATRIHSNEAKAHYAFARALFMTLREDKSHHQLWEDLCDEEVMEEEALTALQAALEADPTMYSALNLLGRLYAVRGRPDDAILTWRQSLAINPDQPEVREEIAVFRAYIAADRDKELERELARTRPHHWKFIHQASPENP